MSLPDDDVAREQALFLSAVKGDRSAIGQLLENYAPEVRRAIEGKIDQRWRSLLSEDDVMQQTFADAFVGLPKLKPDSMRSLKNWLITLAMNNLRDAVRHLHTAKSGGQAAQVKAGSDESYYRLMQDISASMSTPSVKAARTETHEKLQACIKKLPAAYAKIIEAYDLEGQSAEDVARQAGCSLGAMYMRRSRAHTLLARLMENSV